jgi:hypothetical protein
VLQAFTLALAFAGIAAINDVLPVPLSICRLPYSFGCLLSLRLSMVAIDPAVDGWLVTPLLSCCGGGLYWILGRFGTLSILAFMSRLVVDVTRSLA